MPHTFRLDSTPLITDKFVIGDPGLGVLGSEVPCSVPGIDDPPGCNDSLDPDLEYMFRITTWPTSGTLIPYEDSSFTYSNPVDGAYFYEYQLYESGATVGSPVRVDLYVGVSPTISGTGVASLLAVTASATGTVDYLGSSGTAAAILSPVTGAGTATFSPSPVSGVAAAALGEVTASATGVVNYSGVTGVGSANLSSVTASGVGDFGGSIDGIGDANLPVITASGTGALDYGVIIGTGTANFSTVTANAAGIVTRYAKTPGSRTIRLKSDDRVIRVL